MYSRTNRASGISWRQVMGTAAVFLVALVTLSTVALGQGETPQAPAPGSRLAVILDKLHGALDALDDRATASAGPAWLTNSRRSVRRWSGSSRRSGLPKRRERKLHRSRKR